MHERSLHNKNCFITLTYSDEHLPEGGSLVLEHFQDFMKRLRRKISPEKISFYHCGEYGEELGRPHYHAIIFGYDFPDKTIAPKKYQNSKQGDILYVSELLNERWGMGVCIIGNATFESAAYVARYITKKINGEKKEAHYRGKKPEYATMSRRPPIASKWFEKYENDVYPNDYIILRGRKMLPPKYYDRKYEITDEDNHSWVKKERKKRAIKNKDNNTPERLAVREKVKQAKTRSLKRRMEEK